VTALLPGRPPVAATPAEPVRRLLVVSSVRWGYLWQRHQALATAAAEAGWQVDFLQPRVHNVRQALTYPARMLRRSRVEQSHGEPVPGVTVIGLRGWFRRWPAYDLALVYLPDWFTELRLLLARPTRVVYDAVLDWATVPPAWFPPLGWRGAERRIARRRNGEVVTDAEGMLAVLEQRGLPGRLLEPAADPAFVEAGRRPFAGRRRAALYFGSVRDEIDVPALVGLAAAGVEVDVIGPVEEPALSEALLAGGVRVLPKLPLAAMAEAVAGYRVVLLPYRGARSATLMPAKFWNGVASGAWVVTHGLGRLPASPTVLSSDGTLPSLVGLVRGALDAPPPVAPAPSWAARWRELAGD
jgi:hypothetical protein